MSDNQRRTVCRILFLLVCILPTSVVGYWICHPQTAIGWERAIQAELGVTTKIDSVETPGPYVTILRGLEFTDPVVGTVFETVETRIEFGKELNLVTIPYQVKHLTSKGLTQLVQSINQSVMRRHGADKHWRIVFEEPARVSQSFVDEIAGGGFAFSKNVGSRNSAASLQLVSSVTLSDIQIYVAPTNPVDDGTFAEVRFKVEDASKESTGEFVVCGISNTDQDGHVVQVNASSTALPCWLLADAFSFLPDGLGANATFRGELYYVPELSNVVLEVAGVFENVDLAKSVPAAQNQPLASIRLDRCKFEKGDLAEWTAFLIRDRDSPPSRIRKDDLFKYNKQVDIAQAIANTMFGKPRSAELDKN